MSDAHDDYKALVRRLALDEDAFIQLTLKGKIRGGAQSPWRMITVRPVQLKTGRHLQFSYFDARQDITRNYAGDEAVRQLDEALAIPFSVIVARTTHQDVTVQISKKGKALIHSAAPRSTAAPDLAHDASKALPIPAGQPDAYLHATGIMNSAGQIRPGKSAKFHQINEFLKLLEHTGELDNLSARPLRVVDFGCGAAYLTLGTYHYLNHIRGIPALVDGVDNNPQLIARNTRAAHDLGYEGAHFYESAISDYAVSAPPDIVLALHACDTATDDALAQAIRHQARLVLAAPCCHHHLHQQLQPVDPFRPVLRHGIMKKRLGDLLTDSLRALILRISGYKTDVIEFVASEHTDRNLMIRAARRDDRQVVEDFAREYLALKAFWGVTPYLETLLGESFQALLASA